jgi:hypothetical protein
MFGWMVAPDPNDATLYGVEGSWNHTLKDGIKWSGAASWNHTEQSGQPLVGEAKWLMTQGVIWNLSEAWKMGANYRYQGEIITPTSPITGTSTPLESSHQLNLTANWSGLGQGSTLQLGVENVLDHDLRYPSTSSVAYPEHYSRPGRFIWVGIDIPL